MKVHLYIPNVCRTAPQQVYCQEIKVGYPSVGYRIFQEKGNIPGVSSWKIGQQAYSTWKNEKETLISNSDRSILGKRMKNHWEITLASSAVGSTAAISICFTHVNTGQF